MTEYVIVLTAMLGMYVATPLVDEVAKLENAFNNKNKGYAYALSLSDFIDSEDINELSEYFPDAPEQFEKLADTYNKFDEFTNGGLPSGLDHSGMPDIDLGDILNSLL
jgi:hypothetical protein